MATFKRALCPTLIYVYRIPDKHHEGYLKIGQTSFTNDVGDDKLQPNSHILNEAAHQRIKQQTQTAAVKYELLHTELSAYMKEGQLLFFRDHAVHEILQRSGIKRMEDGQEWFHCTLKTVRNAIAAARAGRSSLRAGEVSDPTDFIEFRPEQREAIDKAKKHFKHPKGRQFLWNAKMRFGKTLSALQLVKEMKYHSTLILTHRPVVNEGWYEDFRKIFTQSDYRYGSKDKGAHLEELLKGETPFVYFVSMQDLRGSEQVGGSFDKNDSIFSHPWDLIINDEAHEGTQTQRGKNVLNELRKNKETRLLQLSGTPFNLLDDYKEQEVFTWDYAMEQRAKAQWWEKHFDQPNPYADLPAMHIYTYDLQRLIAEQATHHFDGIEDKAFTLNAFFSTKPDGSFVYEQEVDQFLDLLCSADESSLYPYATPAFRDIFRHSLWVLPGVKEARALSKKLKAHRIFGAFGIANVAGDGDEEVARSDALSLVRETMGDDPERSYSITLTCGRLTTGVTVPEWTAVLMLYGGALSTTAASYMQTIFRVQTPYKPQGRTKDRCYAFDFAPDRALSVIVETVERSNRFLKCPEPTEEGLKNFINFCPVIAMNGSEMKPYDVDGLMEQLHRVRVERAIRSGFEDSNIYNLQALMELSDDDLSQIQSLEKIIGKTSLYRKNTIDINQQGLIDGNHGTGKKRKSKLSREEEALRREKNKKKRQAIDTLRGISIRMPLLLFGAQGNDEEKLTLEHFTDWVDDASWQEFMPRGVSKDVFQKFTHYYDPIIFQAAGKRIRAMTRAADSLLIEQRIAEIANIFASFRNPDKETVLTPWRVVNMHLGEAIGGYVFYDSDYQEPLTSPRWLEHEGITSAVFHPHSHILEINAKSGLYPLYAAYTLYRQRWAQLPVAKQPSSIKEEQAIWEDILQHNLFILCKTPMAASITRRTLAGFRPYAVRAVCYDGLLDDIQEDPQKVQKTLRSRKFWGIHNAQGTDMHFDIVLGNPPYQITAQDTSDTPIYHSFIDLGANLSKRVSLITPARYLFDAGKTPKEWNAKVLHDEHYKVIWYRPNSTDVFPNVDIKGGLAVMYRDATQHFGEIGHFISYPELAEIRRKVWSMSKTSIADLVYAPESYKLAEQLHKEHPSVKDRLSEGHAYDITTNIFEKLPDLFTKERHETDVGFYGRLNRDRCYRWIKKEYIEPHPNLEKYKVIVPKSNGSGAIGEVLSTPLIGEPLIGVTQTFITIGAFDTRAEAEACLKYIKTKFVRTLLGILKVTQHNPKDTWRLIPLQDFTAHSDLNWAQSVADIDRQLYVKYGLSRAEIAFIEEKVTAMD